MKFNFDWKEVAAFGVVGGAIGLGSSVTQLAADFLNITFAAGPDAIGLSVVTIGFSIAGGLLVGAVVPGISKILG